jgi:hypothetical protein
MTTEQENAIIEEIIESFKTFAFGDIEYNVEKKPIAAFILCSCLIDQLAAFTYNEPNERNNVIYKRFIKEYLSHYIPLNLYVNLRCKLVHNYTVGEHIRLTSEDAPFENTGLGKNINVLTAKIMYNDLKVVFENLCIELRNQNSVIRQNAIGRYKYDNSKIITKVQQKFTTYLEYEADILVTHFSKELIDGQFDYKNTRWTINKIDKKEFSPGYFLVFIVATNGKETIQPQIDELITALNLETSTSVLNRLDDIQHNNPRSGGNPA